MPRLFSSCGNVDRFKTRTHATIIHWYKFKPRNKEGPTRHFQDGRFKLFLSIEHSGSAWRLLRLQVVAKDGPRKSVPIYHFCINRFSHTSRHIQTSWKEHKVSAICVSRLLGEQIQRRTEHVLQAPALIHFHTSNHGPTWLGEHDWSSCRNHRDCQFQEKMTWQGERYSHLDIWSNFVKGTGRSSGNTIDRRAGINLSARCFSGLLKAL